MKIPLASNGVRDEDISAAINVLNSGNLTMGKNVRDFENLVASYLKVKHFVMMNSGSSANLSIIEALLRPVKGSAKIRPGDAVLVPAIAWPTTIWPLIQLGLVPLFVDVEEDSLSIDLISAEEIIKKSKLRISAIFPIHVLGRAIPHQELLEFALRNNLLLINDVCESLGSWENGVHAGTSGVASSFSFYFSHHITTMEGGGVATNDDDVANDLRSIRSHGWSRDRTDAEIWQAEKNQTDSKFLFVSTGFNVRPMEVQAAMGISQIRDIDSFIGKRREIATLVAKAVRGSKLRLVDSVFVEDKNQESGHSWMLLPLQIVSDEKNLDQLNQIKNKFLKKFTDCEIETRPALTGNFLAQPGLQRIMEHRQQPADFPNANYFSSTTFLVGCHHDFSADEVSYLVKCIEEISHS
jgi:CDP-6-deoxy-D-xylo-4-hexulose-3-dehydrase